MVKRKSSRLVVEPKWWKHAGDQGHDIYTEYGECICLRCGRRWTEGDVDVPKCDATHKHPTAYGLNCIRELKKLFED